MQGCSAFLVVKIIISTQLKITLPLGCYAKSSRFSYPNPLSHQLARRTIGKAYTKSWLKQLDHDASRSLS